MSDDGRPPADVKTPLSFKIMVVLTAIYLGYRLVQGIVWLVEKLT